MNLFIVGNYTKSHRFSTPWAMEKKINISLIPIGEAPFSTFSRYSGCVDTDSVVEPINDKTEKVSFIYYGHRILLVLNHCIFLAKARRNGTIW